MPPIAAALALASYVPSILKWVTGNDKVEAAAAKIVDIAQVVTGQSSPEAAVQVIQEDPAKLREFELAIRANETELDRMFLADIQNARERDIELARLGHKNYRANVLVAVALLLVILCLFIVVWQSDANDYAKATISLILGRALGWVEQIFSFEFGSTRTNKTKDDTINNLSSKP